jgi:hypothetical protein
MRVVSFGMAILVRAMFASILAVACFIGVINLKKVKQIFLLCWAVVGITARMQVVSIGI